MLVAGATGAAGSLAVQVGCHLGAGKVIAVGRGHERFTSLGAYTTILLDGDADVALRQAFDAGVDVVLDFAWSEPAHCLLQAAASGRSSRTDEVPSYAQPDEVCHLHTELRAAQKVFVPSRSDHEGTIPDLRAAKQSTKRYRLTARYAVCGPGRFGSTTKRASVVRTLSGRST